MEHRQVEIRPTTARRSSGDDPARFLEELRQLRDGAGLGPAELAARAHYPYDRIRAAEAGPSLPDLPVLSAYVRGCGGTTEEWEERWRSLTSAQTLPLLSARPAGSSTAASAGARIGSISPAADTPDPSIILAALDRVAEEMAVGNPAVGEPSVWETTATWGAEQAAADAEPATSAAEVTGAKATDAEPPVPAPAPEAAAPVADPGAASVRSGASTPTASDLASSAKPVGATPAVADERASTGAPTASSGLVVSGWTGPAPSRTVILAAIALVICVLVAALLIFA